MSIPTSVQISGGACYALRVFRLTRSNIGIAAPIPIVSPRSILILAIHEVWIGSVRGTEIPSHRLSLVRGRIED